jgi:hypothetical protein
VLRTKPELSRTNEYGKNILKNETIDLDHYNYQFAVGLEIVDKGFQRDFASVSSNLFEWEASFYEFNYDFDTLTAGITYS